METSVWKLIHDRNAAFLGRFIDESCFDKAGLTETHAKLCYQKHDSKTLKGIVRGPRAQYQVRFSIAHKQYVLFVSHCLPVAALMYDLFLSMLTRYPHCVKKWRNVEPSTEDARFNFPLSVRDAYADLPDADSMVKDVCQYVASAEKVLLDKGILYPISPEELESQRKVTEQVKVTTASAAQKRYQTRKVTQLEAMLEQIQSLARTQSELHNRIVDYVRELDIIKQRIQFNSAVCQSLQTAIQQNTAAFKQLIEAANEHQHHEHRQPSQQPASEPVWREDNRRPDTIEVPRLTCESPERPASPGTPGTNQAS